MTSKMTNTFINYRPAKLTLCGTRKQIMPKYNVGWPFCMKRPIFIKLKVSF